MIDACLLAIYFHNFLDFQHSFQFLPWFLLSVSKDYTSKKSFFFQMRLGLVPTAFIGILQVKMKHAGLFFPRLCRTMRWCTNVLWRRRDILTCPCTLAEKSINCGMLHNCVSAEPQTLVCSKQLSQTPAWSSFSCQKAVHQKEQVQLPKPGIEPGTFRSSV